MLSCHTIHHDGRPCLKLSGELTIYTAAQARREIPERLAKAGAQALDLSAVEELDTAGVQLLLWLKREAIRAGGSMVLVRHSPVVVETLDLLKLAGLFGDPILLAPCEP